MKKILCFSLIAIMMATILAGCSGFVNSKGFDTKRAINLTSREEGSGTRGAFVEIIGILEKDAEGNQTDRTYDEATIQNSTEAIMTTVAGDKYGIGYISLGSLNDTVKVLKIEGADATSDNVQDGSYKLSRPFNVAYKGKLSPLAQDFMDFILSAEGQAIVIEEGYVQVGIDLPAYKGTGQEGDLVVAGSTSVTPVMEKLSEAYQELYSGVSIEIQSTGSSAGMQSAIEGTADLGMASRELKDSELVELTAQIIAVDGIAVIINKENTIEGLTIDQLKSVYIGEATEWTSVVN